MLLLLLLTYYSKIKDYIVSDAHCLFVSIKLHMPAYFCRSVSNSTAIYKHDGNFAQLRTKCSISKSTIINSKISAFIIGY